MSVRPEWWGARPDGNPDGAAYNAAAIEKAAASYPGDTFNNEYIDPNLKITFRTGTYYINQKIDLYPHTYFVGEGDSQNAENAAVIKLKDGSNCDMFQTVLSTKWKSFGFENLRLDGGAQTNASRGLVAIATGGQGNDKYFHIRNNHFTSFNDYAFYAKGIAQSFVEGNVVENSFNGMYFGVTFDGWIRNNKVSVTGEFGIYLWSGDIFEGNEVDGNHVAINCVYDGYHGDVPFANNHLHDCVYGIRTAAPGIVSGNTIENNTKNGIYSGADASSNPVTCTDGNPMISGNTIRNNGEWGIKIDNCEGGGFIKKNIFSGNGLGAISRTDNVRYNNSGWLSARHILIENNTGVDDLSVNYPTLETNNPFNASWSNVAVSKHWKTNNASAKTITNFLYAPAGKEADIHFGDSNTTLKFANNSGPDLVKNGGFDTTPDTNWQWGSGWSLDATGMAAKHSAGGGGAILAQDMGITKGLLYDVKFTVKNHTSGTAFVGVRWDYEKENIFIDHNGTFESILATFDGNSGTLRIFPSSDFDGMIDDVSVKKIDSALRGNGGVDKKYNAGDVVKCIKAADGYWDCE
jgi:parallel beta-helix repeat protein